MILSTDLGTSALKAGLVTPQGGLFARHRVSYRQSYNASWETFRPQYWESAFVEALKAMPSAAVSAVALSGNGPTLVPVDREGRPTHWVNLWLLPRSLPQEDAPSYYLPRARWLKENMGPAWEKTTGFLSCPEYLHYRLTGRKVMTLPHAKFQPYLWDAPQLARYGLDADFFPELVPMTQTVGKITPEAAAWTGLAEGTPVITAGSDFMAALLGSGAVEPGRVCDRTGTSEGINYCSPVPSGDSRLRDLPHAVEPYWNVAAILSSTGSLFEEYRWRTGQGRDSYEKIFQAIAQTPAGASQPLFFPKQGDQGYWEFSKGHFRGLRSSHGPQEQGRAVMESIGFALRKNLEIMEELGLRVETMRVTGGQARGDFWNQMKADITGCRLLVPEIEDAELTGGVCAASVALGRFDSLLQAVEAIVRIKKIYEPRPAPLKMYEQAYAFYQEAAQDGAVPRFS